MHIDWWTLALQTVNVLILIWILARFFFRPVMDIVAKRQQEANKLLADADRARQEAATMRADADKTRAKIAAAGEGLMAEARKAALVEKQNLLAQSSQQIAKLRGEAEVAIARDRAAAEAALIDRASELSVEIARRLLMRFPQRQFLSAFTDGMCREVRALSAEDRESLAAAATADHPLEVVSAAPLSGEETQRVHAALKEAFARELPVVFRSDPALIGGVELRGQNAILRNSWRADLDRIRQELSRERHTRRS